MVGIGDLYDDFKALCKQWFYEKSEVDTALNGKQATLVSGTNIKTVNNQSLLGGGDITIQGGGGGLTFDDIYPIGSIYMSVNSTSPQTLFGGTWQQLTDTFLYASSTADANSTTATSGEATHSLTQSEMPRHTHTQNGHSHSPSGDYDYFIATPTGGGAVSRNSNAGQTGTKVQNLLQSASGVARTNTNSVTATNKYTGGSGTSESASNGSAHNNMPPYMKVYMWKRTA